MDFLQLIDSNIIFLILAQVKSLQSNQNQLQLNTDFDRNDDEKDQYEKIQGSHREVHAPFLIE